MAPCTHAHAHRVQRCRAHAHTCSLQLWPGCPLPCRYAAVFHEEEVTLDVLATFELDELQMLGLTAGSAKKLTEAIKRRRTAP